MRNPRYIYTLSVDAISQRKAESGSYIKADKGVNQYGNLFSNTSVNTIHQYPIPPSIHVKVRSSRIYAIALYNASKTFISGEYYANPESGDIIDIDVNNARYISITYLGALPTDYADDVFAEIEAVTHPVFDDIQLTDERESGQMFYRRKCDTALTFIGKEYDLIMQNYIESYITFSIYRNNVSSLYWKGRFARTDLTVDMDSKIVKVKPNVLDEYTDIMDILNDEKNIVRQNIPITQCSYGIRPIFQIYGGDDDTVTEIIGNQYMKAEAVNPTDDYDLLVKKAKDKGYQMQPSMFRYTLIGTGTPSMYGVLNRYISGSDIHFEGKLVAADNSKYATVSSIRSGGAYTTIIHLYSGSTETHRYSGNKKIFDNYEHPDKESFITTQTFDLTPIGSGTSCRVMNGQMTNFYTRLLVGQRASYGIALPINDLTARNDNYPYVSTDTTSKHVLWIEASVETTTTPNEYGLISNSSTKYFAPKGGNYIPILKSWWGYGTDAISYWLRIDASWYTDPQHGERLFTSSKTLKDAYKVKDVIKSLVSSILPNITIDIQIEEGRELIVTPKSNVIKSNYTQAAQKGMMSLNTIFNMLKNAYNAYWDIEGNTLHIRNISAYYNRGVGLDATILHDARNDKALTFATSRYQYNKDDIPEGYKWSWMDDVTEGFEGFGIKCISPFVTKGKTEEINIGDFTSDIDTILTLPETISKDGFALLSVQGGGVPIIGISIGSNRTMYLNNGYASMAFLNMEYWKANMPTRKVVINEKDIVIADNNIKRTLVQDDISIPTDNDINPMYQIKTTLGFGNIQKNTLSLLSRNNKLKLTYSPYDITE